MNFRRKAEREQTKRTGRFAWSKPAYGGRVEITSGPHEGRRGRKVATSWHDARIRFGPLARAGVGRTTEAGHFQYRSLESRRPRVRNQGRTGR